MFDACLLYTSANRGGPDQGELLAGGGAGECGGKRGQEDEVQPGQGPQGEDPPRALPEAFRLEDFEGARDRTRQYGAVAVDHEGPL